MKKRILFIIFALLLCISLSLPAFAEENLRVQDFADLLSDSEEDALLKKLDTISKKYEADVVVLTVDTLDGYTPQNYADDFFDYNGYGLGDDNSGVLLLISTEDNDWYISTAGSCISDFEDEIEDIGEEMLDDLKAGNFASAFNTFAERCEYILENPFEVGKSLIIALAVAIIAAFIVTSFMKGELKSIKAKNTASDYVKSGSMAITDSRDFFLYRTISRIRKPQNNGGSHRSSSGASHGGGGGKF